MFRLLQAFYATAWAIEPSVYALMCEVLERWASGAKLTEAQIAEAINAGPLSPEAAAARRDAAAQASGGAVAVIPVYGVLTHRAYAASNVSRPLASTEALAAQIRAAVSNPDVGSVVLDIDSPGGSVFGVQELGDTIYSLRGSKPIIAVANAQANSGAYWIASQADEIVVTPSGAVGSVGVIMQHTDTSAMQERMGVRKTVITAGKYKGEGQDGGPLSEETQAYLQSLADTYYDAFVKAVAKGRGVQASQVRGEAFGEGRIKLARAAVDSGMADRIDTLENVINKLARVRRSSGMAASAAAAHLAVIEASAPHIE